MVQLILQNNMFSDSQKENCLPVIKKILELANLARQQGIFALEMATLHEEPFLKTGITIVCDGCCPETIQRIMENLILADNFSGEELLKRLLMAEGILAIQKGENPRILALYLISILGEKYLPEAETLWQEQSERTDYKFLKTLNNEPLPENAAFEEKIFSLSNREIELIIQHTEYGDLVNALRNCQRNVIYRILMCVSKNIFTEICKDLQQPGDISFTTNARNRILKTIQRLENNGEIVTFAKNESQEEGTFCASVEVKGIVKL